MFTNPVESRLCHCLPMFSKRIRFHTLFFAFVLFQAPSTTHYALFALESTHEPEPGTHHPPAHRKPALPRRRRRGARRARRDPVRGARGHALRGRSVRQRQNHIAVAHGRAHHPHIGRSIFRGTKPRGPGRCRARGRARRSHRLPVPGSPAHAGPVRVGKRCPAIIAEPQITGRAARG